MKVIKSAWIKAEGLPFSEKLRTIKEDLKQWNIHEYGAIDINIKQLEEKISHFDGIANNRFLNSLKLQERKEAQLDLWTWLKRRESYWAQNSRVKWIKEGDRNTKFFHTFASIRRRKNLFERLV